MKNKKIPMRSCVVTREKLPKKELIRVVRTPEGTVKCNGRGAYLKLSLEVIEKAKMTKVLDRQLEVEVPAQIYEDLKNLLK